MQTSEVAKLLGTIKNIYDNFVITKEKIEVWSRYMQNISYEQASEYLDWHAINEKYPPTISDFHKGKNKGPAILNAEETKKRTKELSKWYFEGIKNEWKGLK